jgi:hypothetical protein
MVVDANFIFLRHPLEPQIRLSPKKSGYLTCAAFRLGHRALPRAWHRN